MQTLEKEIEASMEFLKQVRPQICDLAAQLTDKAEKLGLKPHSSLIVLIGEFRIMSESLEAFVVKNNPGNAELQFKFNDLHAEVRRASQEFGKKYA